jgi:ABC-type glycerol-3-phosphate transport system permease component
VCREFVLEPVPSCREARLAHLESYGPIMAGAVLSALPLLIVFLVANRRIVEGVRVSALKG